MKAFSTTTGLVLLLASVAAARQQSPATFSTTTREQSLLARVTVYWASGGRGSDRYTRQHRSSTGTRLRTGHCAVDPRKIPYGSQVIFPDRTGLIAVDTGSAVRSRRAARRGGRNPNEKSAIVVDRFFETKGQALAWARRNPAFMTVRVVPPSRNPVFVQPNQRAVQVVSNRALASNATVERKPGYRSVGQFPATPKSQPAQQQIAPPIATTVTVASNSTTERKPRYRAAGPVGKGAL